MHGRSLKSAFVLGPLLVAAVSVAAGVAWACVPFPQALATLQPRSSGPPGMEVTVNGLGYDQGPIEVRWNALDGPRLATATGPNFSVPATIPQAADGLYTMVVLSRGADGSIGSAGSTPFEILSSTAARSGNAWSAAEWSERSEPSAGSPVPALLTGGALVAGGGAAGAVAARRWRRPQASEPEGPSPSA